MLNEHLTSLYHGSQDPQASQARPFIDYLWPRRFPILTDIHWRCNKCFKNLLHHELFQRACARSFRTNKPIDCIINSLYGIFVETSFSYCFALLLLGFLDITAFRENTFSYGTLDCINLTLILLIPLTLVKLNHTFYKIHYIYSGIQRMLRKFTIITHKAFPAMYKVHCQHGT